MASERYIEGEIAARKHSQDVAKVVLAHLRVSDHPQAAAWSEAIDWFRQRIKGGHLSIYAQQEFDRRFGVVDWSAFPISDEEQAGEASR